MEQVSTKEVLFNHSIRQLFFLSPIYHVFNTGLGVNPPSPGDHKKLGIGILKDSLLG